MDEYTTPDNENAALLTIDVQRDFTLPGAPAEVPGTSDAVPRMSQVVEAFREKDAPVVHVVRLYRSDGSNADACRRSEIESGAAVVEPGTDGAEIVDELADASLDAELLLDGDLQSIGRSEWVMYKPRWGAFYETPLEEHLASLSVNTVVVCGCNFPNCPRTTVYEASERDFRVVFVPDATSQTYERGLDELENIGVSVMRTYDVVEWISG